MKKCIKCLFLFVYVFSIFMLMIDASTIQYGIVKSANGKGINIRSGPGTSTKYSVLGTGAGEGSLVKILDTVNTNDGSTTCNSGKWYKIEYNQVSSGIGYACTSFVNLLDIDTDDAFEASLATFPESYHEKLRLLHAIYPNAIFKAYETGLDFQKVVDNEDGLGKSLVWDSNNSRDGLKHLDSYDYKTNTFYNKYSGGGKNWYAASAETIAYYIDPRNFLNESRIFMYETLSYNSAYHTLEGIESTLRGSFMHNTFVDSSKEKFSDVIMEAGKTYGVSPYYIGSRILQETGSSRSSLVLGTYPDYPDFDGYYNFFNYGAGGNNVVYNGLKYAFDNGWNSEKKAIVGGVSKIGTSYIGVGQDTNYFQKWDVICKSKYSSSWSGCGYYSHQYMQNIEAPYSEAKTTYNAYKDNLGSDMYLAAYVFTVPVYENMPPSTSLPSEKNPINYLSRLVINGTSVTNFDSLTTTYKITLPIGVKSVSIEASAISSKASIMGLGTIEITKNEQIIPITVIAENGNKLVYNITVMLSDDVALTLEETLQNMKSGTIDGNFISGLTSVDVVKNTVNKANAAASVTIYDTNSKIVDSGSLGTGYLIEIIVGEEKKQLEVVIYGDTNGDTEITVLDLLRVQKQLLSSITMHGSQLKASDVNRDGKVDVLDLLLIRKHLLGSSTINQ